jgi:hypothetical protein
MAHPGGSRIDRGGPDVTIPLDAPRYHYTTTWRVTGDVTEVARILFDGPDFPRWWPSVYLEIITTDPGDARRLGSTADLRTKGWLPYHLRWTRDIVVVQPLLRRFSFLARPVFGANHRWAMARGLESLRLELTRRHAADEDERAAIPPPPGPTPDLPLPLVAGGLAALALVVVLVRRVLR